MFKIKDITTICLKTGKKIKDFFSGKNGREFLIFLFFFMIAALFWLFQTLHNRYEIELAVPITHPEKADRNLILTSDSVPALQITVRDKGMVLLNYLFAKQFSPIVIDAGNSHPRGKHYAHVVTSKFRKNIQEQLDPTTQLLSVKPDTIEYIYVTGRSKRIPVKLQGKVSPERQSYLANIVIKPDSVRVYAPTEILDTITSAYTLPVHIQNISDTVKLHTALLHARGVKYMPDSVELTFQTDIYTEKTVEVPIHGVDFPADKILRTFPSKVRVTFQLGLKRFSDVNADKFHIEVAYHELLNLGTDQYPVKLKTIPPEINQIIRIDPPLVDFLIETTTP